MRGVETCKVRVRHLKAFFKDIPTTDIMERRIDLYIKHRLEGGRSTTTVNRELQTLGQALRLAKRKKLLKDIPHIDKFSEPGNARQGCLERNAFERIVTLLPDYLQDVARFADCVG